MSHDWNCPDEYEARRQASRDAERDLRSFDGRSSYRSPYECDEANDTYRRAYNYESDRLEEERAMERRRQARREEEQREEEYWQQQQAEEAHARAEEEAYWAEQYAAEAVNETGTNDRSTALDPDTADSAADRDRAK